MFQTTTPILHTVYILQLVQLTLFLLQSQSETTNVMANQSYFSMMQVLILGDKGELFLSGRPLSNDMDMMEDTLMLPQPYAAEDLDDFPPPAVCQPEDERSSDEEGEQSTRPRVILDAPNLAVLCLNEVQRSSALIQNLIEPLQNLQVNVLRLLKSVHV